MEKRENVRNFKGNHSNLILKMFFQLGITRTNYGIN
jgi:hypothetical protein